MTKRSVWLAVAPFLGLLFLIGLMGGFTVMWWCTLGGMLSGGLLVGDVFGRMIVRTNPKRSTPKHAAPTAHDPRRLAQDALDHAAKAADLGLPTGEWTDLAAFWTTWADQQDTVKAAETPAQRPTPPKGGEGTWTGVPLLSTVPDPSKVRATTPPSDIVMIGDNMIIVPHTGNVARYDLLVWHDGHPTPRLIPGVPMNTTSFEQLNLPGKPAKTLARVTMPPHTTTVQQAQITDLRSDRCVQGVIQ